MSLASGFTRRETMNLTSATSNQLQYLERANLVIPERIGKSRKPIVLYSWEQVLEIRAIKNLRDQVSLQAIRKVIEFLNDSGFDDTLRDKQLVVINDDVFWVRIDWKDFSEKMPKALKVASKKNKDIGQYMLTVIPNLISIVNEIWEIAENSNVVDFEAFKSRAKHKAA